MRLNKQKNISVVVLFWKVSQLRSSHKVMSLTDWGYAGDTDVAKISVNKMNLSVHHILCLLEDVTCPRRWWATRQICFVISIEHVTLFNRSSRLIFPIPVKLINSLSKANLNMWATWSTLTRMLHNALCSEVKCLFLKLMQCVVLKSHAWRTTFSDLPNPWVHWEHWNLLSLSNDGRSLSTVRKRFQHRTFQIRGSAWRGS